MADKTNNPMAVLVREMKSDGTIKYGDPFQTSIMELERQGWRFYPRNILELESGRTIIKESETGLLKMEIVMITKGVTMGTRGGQH